MVGINQRGKEVVTFHFCLGWVHHVKLITLTGLINFEKFKSSSTKQLFQFRRKNL